MKKPVSHLFDLYWDLNQRTHPEMQQPPVRYIMVQYPMLIVTLHLTSYSNHSSKTSRNALHPPSWTFYSFETTTSSHHGCVGGSVCTNHGKSHKNRLRLGGLRSLQGWTAIVTICYYLQSHSCCLSQLIPPHISWFNLHIFDVWIHMDGGNGPLSCPDAQFSSDFTKSSGNQGRLTKVENWKTPIAHTVFWQMLMSFWVSRSLKPHLEIGIYWNGNGINLDGNNWWILLMNNTIPMMNNTIGE